MKRRPFLVVLLLLVAVHLLPATAGESGASEPAGDAAGTFRRVFILHSYNPEYIWTQNINLGVLESLRDLKVVYDSFYMDAKRRPDEKSLQKAAGTARERIADFAPDVVIAVDDVAQAYVVAPSLRGKPAPQVIFCGVNAPPSLYGFPASNVSGVRERWHFREGFALLKRVLPSARRVAFLTDASESSGYVIRDMRDDLAKGGPFALELLHVDSVGSYQEWQRRIIMYQTSADVVALGIYHSLLDERTGRVVTPEEAAAWMQSVNTKPTLGFADYALSDVLCGVLEAGHEQGFLAGNMARSVLLRGEAAGALPMSINERGVIMLNLRIAERLKVDIPYEIIEAAGEVVK
ncbi:MAG: ABC transporter substrate-binding protein [Acidobacteriota bacterium]